jgi:pullulanase/glycogen debranching enzyme
LRTRQVKNFIALTLLSVGTPMLLAGDEVRSSQRGNNNAYFRNDELFSFDWTLVRKIRGGSSIHETTHRVSSKPKASSRTFRHDIAGIAAQAAHPMAWSEAELS